MILFVQELQNGEKIAAFTKREVLFLSGKKIAIVHSDLSTQYGINPYALEELMKYNNKIEMVLVCHPIQVKKLLIGEGFGVIAGKIALNTRGLVKMVEVKNHLVIAIDNSQLITDGLEGVDCPHWITS